MRIIKVEEIDSRGYTGEVKYFKSINKAKKSFKKFIKKHKGELVKPEDASQEKPIMPVRKIPASRVAGKRYKETALECYLEDSYCADEISETITILLEEIKVEE